MIIGFSGCFLGSVINVFRGRAGIVIVVFREKMICNWCFVIHVFIDITQVMLLENVMDVFTDKTGSENGCF